MNFIENKLTALYRRWSGMEPETITQLPQSGSYRQYFRMTGKDKTFIGAYYDQVAENMAFISFSRHFAKMNLNVPEIFAVDDDSVCYLLEDLGDIVLFDYLQKIRSAEGFGEHSLSIYKKILDELVKFQMVAGKSLDYSVCYPASYFDEQAYMWDLNYFKYNFLKLANIPYNEFSLENDFKMLTRLLLTADHHYFVYRDFQTRNILCRNDELYFIDYQGGRKGTLHYDVASLLFQARAEIPFGDRELLLDYYISQAGKIEPGILRNFKDHYYLFVLIRVLQTLGAYGFRGLHEKKQYFISSIPLALINVKWLLENEKIPETLPEIRKVLEATLESNSLDALVKPRLILKINSFSYKRGFPADTSGHGGGFVFDCRALPNPGRYPEYIQMTGLDEPVQAFFSNYPEIDVFIENAYNLVKPAVEVYVSRGFQHLMVSFGCTGGRHRSVYCAEKLLK
jgi:aminoglycoside/choline kinase family phosphotransferase